MFMMPGHADISRRRDAVLSWYDAHRREMPWRADPGVRPDPYHVWLSEIMLQQTTVATVGPYFDRFTARWPRVQDLAAASLDDVLVEWQGLGYYARARNLHKCAVHVAEELDGVFPDTVDRLLELPGVGPYTAAAVGAIAFDRPVVPLDGNIERVTARLFNIDTPLPGAKVEIKPHADLFAGDVRPGDFAQALMDIGATVCTPKNPKCLLCPLADGCGARMSGDPARLPVPAPKKRRPTRHTAIFWIENAKGEVLLRKRPERGLLGGMTEFPSTEWSEAGFPNDDDIAAAAPVVAEWTELPNQAEHVFTHFKLLMRVYKGRASGRKPKDAFWVHPDDFKNHALPTVMKKVVSVVRGAD